MGRASAATVFGVLLVCGAASAQTVEVDPSTGYQSMKGWEVILPYTPAIGADGYVDFDKDKRTAPLIVDHLVNEVGIDRVRFEIHSGAENPTDYYAQYVNKTIAFSAYSNALYEKINDNADPNSVAPNGIHLERVDYIVDTWVKPMQAALKARGETLYVNVCYVDFSTNGRPQGTLSHADHPDEYAEFIVAVFERLRADGVVPDAFEFVLEPENTAWDGTDMGKAAVALSAKLGAAGFSPEYIGPSTTAASNAVPFYEDFIAVAGASDIIDMLAYHLYRGTDNSANRMAILQTAQAHGIQTGMLEFTTATVDQLYPDLTVANASAWEKYAGSSPPRTPSESEYAYLYVEDGATPKVTLARHSAELAPYFRTVRMGAKRVKATDDSADIDPVAFVNADGSHAVILRAKAAHKVTVEGLPDGSYDILFGAPGAASLVTGKSATSSGGTLQVDLAVGVTALRGGDGAPPVADDAGVPDGGTADDAGGGGGAGDSGGAGGGGGDGAGGAAGSASGAGGGGGNAGDGASGADGGGDDDDGASGASGSSAAGDGSGAMANGVSGEDDGTSGDGDAGAKSSKGGCKVDTRSGSRRGVFAMALVVVGLLCRRRGWLGC